jgi:hypothetical protein
MGGPSLTKRMNSVTTPGTAAMTLLTVVLIGGPSHTTMNPVTTPGTAAMTLLTAVLMHIISSASTLFGQRKSNDGDALAKEEEVQCNALSIPFSLSRARAHTHSLSLCRACSLSLSRSVAAPRAPLPTEPLKPT